MTSEFLAIALALLVLIGASFGFMKMIEAKGFAFVASVLISAVVIIPIAILMFHLQSDGQYTYNQFFNGTETSVEMIPRHCDTDTGCHYTYDRAVPYQDCTTSTDSNNHPRTTCTTEYHHYDDPYFTEEDTWVIHSTIGDYTVTSDAIPDHYQPGVAVTDYREVSLSDLARTAQENGTGEPQEAIDAQKAIENGTPRGATMLSPYSNPINGSGAKTAVSDQIDHFKKLGVLPMINASVHDLDQSDKVLFVGLKVPGSWYDRYQQAVSRLNEESGNLTPATRRFDIQIVMVNSNKVPSNQSRVYTTALDAYWQSDEFQHSSLPKNMAVVVLGTDGQKITWGYGFTLIDTANNQLWNLIAVNVPGTSIVPETLIGEPRAVIHNGSLIKIVPSGGVLENLIFGSNGFARSHITDKHAGSVGFDFLMTGPPFWFCCIVFIVMIVIGAIISFFTYALLPSAPSRRAY